MRASIFPIFLLLAAAPAGAAYPDKPIRMIMPYPAGGSIDTAGRAVAQKLADTFGQQIVIDNRTGAGGVIGTETAARPTRLHARDRRHGHFASPFASQTLRSGATSRP
jgi:tripartite-type tricarboxylate transporter receptor subunit TctC